MNWMWEVFDISHFTVRYPSSDFLRFFPGNFQKTTVRVNLGFFGIFPRLISRNKQVYSLVIFQIFSLYSEKIQGYSLGFSKNQWRRNRIINKTIYLIFLEKLKNTLDTPFWKLKKSIQRRYLAVKWLMVNNSEVTTS